MATIAVIEDDDASRMLASYLLEAAGHRVLVAGDGAAGLQLVLQEAPDLILCDLQMPTLNGYQLVAALRVHPRWRPVPVIAVTAFSMPGDRETALQAGFSDHLAKPITPETFAQQVAAFLVPPAAAHTAGAPPPAGTPRGQTHGEDSCC